MPPWGHPKSSSGSTVVGVTDGVVGYVVGAVVLGLVLVGYVVGASVVDSVCSVGSLVVGFVGIHYGSSKRIFSCPLNHGKKEC